MIRNLMTQVNSNWKQHILSFIISLDYLVLQFSEYAEVVEPKS